MTGPDPAALLAEHFRGLTVPGRSYPRPLPEGLVPWYCYTVDGGHSVLVALAERYRPGGDPTTFLVLAPVRSVQRAGWQVRDGYVAAHLEYDPKLGLITDPADDEF